MTYKSNASNLSLILYSQIQGADIASNVIRPDSLPFEPVKVAWPLLAGDVTILTAVNKPTATYVDLTDVIYNFNEITYAFIFLAIFVVSVLTMNNLLTIHKKKPSRIIRSYVESLWNVFVTILDQEYLLPRSEWQKVSWLFFNIVNFVLVFGYLLNLMSTDQLVREKPAAVDSLHDLLFEKEFEAVIPAILKQLHLYNLLSNAKRESEHAKLYQRMLRTESRSIVEFDVQGMSSGSMSEDNPSMVLRDDIGKGKAALCGPRISLGMISTLMPSYFDGKVLHVAKESFLEGTLNLFTSKNIDRKVLEVFNYRLLTFVELNIATPIINIDLLRDLQGICNSCERQKIEAKKLESLPEVANLSLFPLKKTWMMLASGFAVSFLILILEYVYNSVASRMKAKRKHIRTVIRDRT